VKLSDSAIFDMLFGLSDRDVDLKPTKKLLPEVMSFETVMQLMYFGAARESVEKNSE
jgi:hypothetical protein